MSIALRNREEILLGVVYEVCRDECFWTYKGRLLIVMTDRFGCRRWLYPMRLLWLSVFRTKRRLTSRYSTA